jgi:hypothetical protein
VESRLIDNRGLGIFSVLNMTDGPNRVFALTPGHPIWEKSWGGLGDREGKQALFASLGGIEVALKDPDLSFGPQTVASLQSPNFADFFSYNELKLWIMASATGQNGQRSLTYEERVMMTIAAMFAFRR